MPSADKRPRPEIGEVIEVNWRPVFSTNEGFNAVDATVEELLSVQFTAWVEAPAGKSLAFFRYDAKGDSWRFKE